MVGSVWLSRLRLLDLRMVMVRLVGRVLSPFSCVVGEVFPLLHRQPFPSLLDMLRWSCVHLGLLNGMHEGKAGPVRIEYWLSVKGAAL